MQKGLATLPKVSGSEVEEIMKRQPLGQSSLIATPLGHGLAALGRPGYITLGHAADLQASQQSDGYSVAAMQEQTHLVLDQAWAAGIRYFDTARSYGRAEEFLGNWLARRTFTEGDLPVVASKWGYTYTADWRVEAQQHEVKDHTLPVLQRQWQESQQNLGAFLALYQIHSATLESGVLTRTEVLAELAAIKGRGMCIGLSLSGENQGEVLAAAMEVTVDGVPLFDTVQATWNLLETSCGPMLEAAHQAGMGVIIKEALANGRLTARNQEPTFAPQLERLTAIANRQGTTGNKVTADAVALAAVLAQPWANVVLSGATTPDQLRSNVRALDLSLTTRDWEELRTLAESPHEYWATRSNLAWN
jgi:aryl-alcohol dehydrogenase-like predicted oxidoreductase